LAPGSLVDLGFYLGENMGKVFYFIDGFNLYHALDDVKALHKYKWLDMMKLAGLYTGTKDQVAGVYFFTSFAHWDRGKVERHRKLIKAVELTGVKTVYGKFKRKDRFCTLCKKKYYTFEEKQTDINMAIHLFRLAMEGEYDTAVLITGDSDQLATIEAIRKTFPAKRVGVVIPIGRCAEELKNVCDFHIRMKKEHLRSCRFDDKIPLGNGEFLECPPSWK
jgi:uncharacterized LabA/DUF88 family protein